MVKTVDMPVGLPHSFTINADVDGNDVWVAHREGAGAGGSARATTRV